MTNPNRIERDFLQPEPSFLTKILYPLSKLATAPEANIEGIDESVWNNSSGKKVNHAGAIAGGTRFFVIRVTNGLAKDVAFETTWKSALDDGAKNVMIYANILGSSRGKDQAEFAMTSAQAFIDAYSKIGKVVIWGDFEKDNLVVSVPTRQTIALEFLNNIHINYETGIYSNVAYWGSLYGNLKPPPYAWLWGAHWTPYTPIFPSSWDLTKLLIHQYAVWNKYTWSTPVAGNVPDLDNDRWKWIGGTPEEFLETKVPDQDVWAAIARLQQNDTVLTTEYNRLDAENKILTDKVAALSNQIATIKNSTSLLTATFKPIESSLAYKLGSFNAKNNEMFEFYPSGSSDDVSKRIHITTPLKVLVEPVYTGDGAMKMYLIADSDFLAANKPTCMIFVDATKGNLSV